jgi:hypothetical protein
MPATSTAQRLLAFVFLGLIAGGALFVVVPDWVGFAWLNGAVDRAFFGAAEPPPGAVGLRHWLYGVEGATLVAFGILGLAVVRNAIRRQEPWASKALLWAVAIWFVLDTAVSLAHGIWQNAGLNVVIALAVLIPTSALRVSPASPRAPE